MEKISFYEELLKLEPDSRLFYTLAQMYLKEKRYEEATRVLRKGIEAHPSHFEAKLLLTTALAASGNNKEELTKELHTFFQSMQKNVALWAILSDVMSEQDENMALGLRLFVLALQKQKIDWNQIICSGLKTIMPHEPANTDLSTDEMKPQSIVRTRTMADLLLQQNDPQQAREIYQELLQHTDDELEKSELNFMLEKTAETDVSSLPADQKKEQQGLIEALTALADRFDARVETP